jgi:hypothetical protein
MRNVVERVISSAVALYALGCCSPSPAPDPVHDAGVRQAPAPMVPDPDPLGKADPLECYRTDVVWLGHRRAVVPLPCVPYDLKRGAPDPGP